uniref:Nuclear cap-binding protein subunit 3 n=1 Tax=Aotus nancymaae TaxID=37293 RepID=A0A2K5C898_AOTNA
MAAVRGLRAKAEAPAGSAAPGLPSAEAESNVDRGEPEPMEVEEGELEILPVRRTLKELIPDTGSNSEPSASIFDQNTQDVFSCFKEYLRPAYIEWLDDTSCNVVWLDETTATRALINMNSLDASENKSSEKSKKDKQEDSSDDDEAEEGEVEDENSNDVELDTLSQVEEESLLRNDLPNKLAKGNSLFMRFAEKDDKKELGEARRSQYYVKYGNPNYGGMKGILSNSWKRSYHSRRIQREVIKKTALTGDDVGLTSYKHRHSGLVKGPEEPVEEKEEEEEAEEEEDQDMVESREQSASRRSSASGSDSDEMDYDLELKMISTPSPEKSMRMTMYADEVESQLKNIRNSMRADSLSSSNTENRIGNKLPPEKFADVRHLLDEKRHHSRPQPPVSNTKSDIRQRLGKRLYSPEKAFSSNPVVRREPSSDVHSRLGVTRQDIKGLYSDTRKKKSGNLRTPLGSAPKTKQKNTKKGDHGAPGAEGHDSELQRAWAALIKEKEQSRQKKSRLDNSPSHQIEVSRKSSSGSEAEP